MADTWALHGRCPECGAAKYVDQPCPREAKHEPKVPVVHTLIRPISMARIQTIDWDELRDLAEIADSRSATDGAVDTDYARGVHDALRWLADGVPTTALLQLLGGGEHPCA